MTKFIVASWPRSLSIAITALLALGCTLQGQSPEGDSRAWRPIEVIEKRALLIGNADYEGTTPLRNTIADVRALEAALTDLGFEVMSAANLTLEAMKATVREFVLELSPGDLGLFYYSGHGVQVDNENYLLPVDFESGTLRSEVADEAYSASRVMRMLKDQGARVRVMVLDACRNNPYVDERSAGRGLTAMHSGAEGSLIVFTTGEGDVASDNARGDLGLYMTHLLPELRRETVELKETFERTRAAVYHAAIERGETQRPAHYEDLIGRVYVRGGPPSTPPSALQREVTPPPNTDISEISNPTIPVGSNSMAPQAETEPQPLSVEGVREEISAAIKAASLEERDAIEKLENVIKKYREVPSAQQMIALLTEKLEASRVPIEAKWNWKDIEITGSSNDVSDFIDKYKDKQTALTWVRAAESRLRQLLDSETPASRWQSIQQWPRFESPAQYTGDLAQHRREVDEYLAEHDGDAEAAVEANLAKERLVDIALLETATAALDAVIYANTIEALETYLEHHGALKGGSGLAAEVQGRLDFLELPERAAREWEAIKETVDPKVLEGYLIDYGGDIRVASLASLAQARLKLLPKLLALQEAQVQLTEALQSENASALLEVIEEYSNLPEAEEFVDSAIDKWRSFPPAVRAETRWNRIKDVRGLKEFQDYISEFQDYPQTSRWVELARTKFEHWNKYRSIKDAIDEVEFVSIPPGTFRMGSMTGDPDERPLTRVMISEGFMLARFETTQRTWIAVMGENPSEFIECGLDCPVENVSWNDIQKFLTRLNEMEGQNLYRITTEAEWEYASRAGATVEPLGRTLDSVAWHRENSGTRTRLVGSKGANEFGLHDMLGNVWEWVQDWSGRYPDDEVIDPVGPQRGSFKVSRGCSWITEPRQCRLANRNPLSPDDRMSTLGFRLVKSLSAP